MNIFPLIFGTPYDPEVSAEVVIGVCGNVDQFGNNEFFLKVSTKSNSFYLDSSGREREKPIKRQTAQNLLQGTLAVCRLDLPSRSLKEQSRTK
ncbi:MAG: hypothetical protein WBG50_16250 [Desulfomonilaceae bacterium]